MQHLAVKDLSASYGSLPVLKGVSFALNKGEVGALIGPSGSGKSTILRALMGLTPLTGGQIVLDGARIAYDSAASIRAARDQMAIVFQQYNLFQNMNVLKNVSITPIKIKKRPRDEVEAEATAILTRVGLGDKLRAFPDELSGGQQQRVAIARALALRPKILLLDEVTSALDPELVNEVLDAIRGLAHEGMTMLLVSHEMGFVREIANQVIMMDKGQIVETGRPADIFDNPKSDRLRDFVGKILRH